MSEDVIVPFKEYTVSIPVRLTPELTVYWLAQERAKARAAEYLATDLFGPTLVDEFGRPLRAEP